MAEKGFLSLRIVCVNQPEGRKGGGISAVLMYSHMQAHRWKEFVAGRAGWTVMRLLSPLFL